ncbi:MAG: thioesterase II family protein [Parahaliea sp.]
MPGIYRGGVDRHASAEPAQMDGRAGATEGPGRCCGTNWEKRREKQQCPNGPRIGRGMKNPAINLFCLPYSGASAAVYYQWQRKLPLWLKVCPVELPGRGMRMNEPLQTDMAELVGQLAKMLRGRLDAQPYAVFGHSLGGILAFELVRRLVAMNAPAPITLIVSGASAPTQLQRSIGELETLETDDDLFSHLKKLGGMSDDVINNKELILLCHIRSGDNQVVPACWPPRFSCCFCGLAAASIAA